MQLMADRFAVHGDGRAFDLATGARVTLIVGSVGGESEHLRWTERGAMLSALRHPAMPTLVDFGLAGESSRFEAWEMGTQVPRQGTGYPTEELRIADCGLRIVERPEIAALAEMFHTAGGPRPHASAVFGPEGAGKREVVHELARIARARGFVPVASRLIGSRQADLWRGRSLFVIADAADERTWASFLDAALRDAVPHVLLLVGEDECRAVDGVPLRPVPVDALVSAVRPQHAGPLREQTLRRAAERSRGWPGRFARLLWPEYQKRIDGRAVGRPTLLQVAEQPAIYGGEEQDPDVFDESPRPCEWPAPGELAALRRKMEQAAVDVARGRHAPGIRQLRQVAGSLARRGAWSDAASGALALAGALLRRGQPREAHAAIEDGREYATRGDEDALLIDFATLSGDAWIDRGRLDEADSVLGTALAAARAHADPERIASASLALARGSYWRGEYAAAEAGLASVPDVPRARLRRVLLEARIAVGLGDVNRAMTLAARASEAAAVEPDGAKAAVAWVTAIVHVAAGDLGAADRDLSQALALARAAHDPQRALRARLLRAEVNRSSGRIGAASAQLQRLRRVMAAAPAIVRARWDVVKALTAPDADARAIVDHSRQATGLGALGLYVSTRAGRHGGAAAADPFVDELVEILRVCQTAADEIGLLKEVCARLRRHLHAAAVAFMAVRGARVDTMASEGSRIEGEVAMRAVQAGITIAPHRLQDRIEAAAPIEYGGEPIGALCARWTIGSTYDTTRASAVLATSAAAAAPMLAAVAARQAVSDAGASELLGVTAVMAALRQAVARAAAAPFAVLVDGESGSGKELVARAIHRGSARRHKPFCALNCAALPDDLVEAELFGHTRGAFTGAAADRAGVFEEAHGGTLFLDEIGELTPRAQAKLLRVIQDGEIRRVGENLPRRVDVRIVSATNRALRQEVDAGTFRLDLLYRLDVVHITVPPLRERREDIAVLAAHFWRDAAQRVGSRATLGAATVAALARYDWPGNVRELQNVLAALAVRTPARGIVPPSALPPCFGDGGAADSWSLDEARRTFELRFVRAALVRTGGHRGRAAAELGVTRQGLTKLMTRLGITL
jgi:DNA-binding NtrC family response regulator/tetratricopeptide (TPR) repeat protein